MTNPGEPEPASASAAQRLSHNRPASLRGSGCFGKVGRCVWKFLQQPESRSTLYIRFFTRIPQLICTVLVAVLFLVLGGAVYSQSSNPKEVAITYRSGDTTKSFSLAEDLTGTVQIHYEIEGVLLNNKDYVSGKDKDSVYTFFSSVSCTNADTLQWAQLRRGSDSTFISRLTAAGDSALSPCGLVNIALFTDSYTLERQNANLWEAVSIDSSDVAWSRDDNSFNKVYEDQGRLYLANEARASWLPPEWLEHWKVWQRTPPGQTVRNLWGVIQGGLTKGEYRIQLVENSPIWEEWGVVARRLIITGNPSWLGNIGAMQALAGSMLALGCVELVLLAVLVVCVFILQIKPQSRPAASTSPVMPAPLGSSASPAPVPRTQTESQRQREVVHSMRV